MTDGVRNSADKKFEKDKRARGRKKLNFISYDWGLVFGQDMFVESVKAERSGIEVDHKDVVEDRFENRDKGLMVGVGEVVRSGLFIVEGDDEAMSESFVKPFRAVVDSPFQRTDAGNFAF